jgi:3-hexulose-6-phosphate synthase
LLILVLEAEIAFKCRFSNRNGAVDDETIKGAVEAAKKYGRKVVVDTIELKTEYKELKK